MIPTERAYEELRDDVVDLIDTIETGTVGIGHTPRQIVVLLRRLVSRDDERRLVTGSFRDGVIR